MDRLPRRDSTSTDQLRIFFQQRPWMGDKGDHHSRRNRNPRTASPIPAAMLTSAGLKGPTAGTPKKWPRNATAAPGQTKKLILQPPKNADRSRSSPATPGLNPLNHTSKCLGTHGSHNG